MNLKTSSDAMNLQADLRAAELEDIIMRDYSKPTKFWSNSPTSKFVTTFAEGLIKSVTERTSLYRARRVGTNSFQVEYLEGGNKVDSADSLTHEELDYDGELLGVPIPRFRRLRFVSVDSTGTLFCSCCAFQNRGIFCEHQCATATLIYEIHDQTFGGFTHHDVALRYLISYMHLAYRHSTPVNIRQMFDGMVKSEIRGPRLQIFIPSVDMFPVE